MIETIIWPNVPAKTKTLLVRLRDGTFCCWDEKLVKEVVIVED